MRRAANITADIGTIYWRAAVGAASQDGGELRPNG
jgi:hypothetical protein